MEIPASQQGLLGISTEGDEAIASQYYQIARTLMMQRQQTMLNAGIHVDRYRKTFSYDETRDVHIEVYANRLVNHAHIVVDEHKPMPLGMPVKLLAGFLILPRALFPIEARLGLGPYPQGTIELENHPEHDVPRLYDAAHDLFNKPTYYYGTRDPDDEQEFTEYKGGIGFGNLNWIKDQHVLSWWGPQDRYLAIRSFFTTELYYRGIAILEHSIGTIIGAAIQTANDGTQYIVICTEEEEGTEVVSWTFWRNPLPSISDANGNIKYGSFSPERYWIWPALHNGGTHRPKLTGHGMFFNQDGDKAVCLRLCRADFQSHPDFLWRNRVVEFELDIKTKTVQQRWFDPRNEPDRETTVRIKNDYSVTETNTSWGAPIQRDSTRHYTRTWKNEGHLKIVAVDWKGNTITRLYMRQFSRKTVGNATQRRENQVSPAPTPNEFGNTNQSGPYSSSGSLSTVTDSYFKDYGLHEGFLIDRKTGDADLIFHNDPIPNITYKEEHATETGASTQAWPGMEEVWFQQDPETPPYQFLGYTYLRWAQLYPHPDDPSPRDDHPAEFDLFSPHHVIPPSTVAADESVDGTLEEHTRTVKDYMLHIDLRYGLFCWVRREAQNRDEHYDRTLRKWVWSGGFNAAGPGQHRAAHSPQGTMNLPHLTAIVSGWHGHNYETHAEYHDIDPPTLHSLTFQGAGPNGQENYLQTLTEESLPLTWTLFIQRNEQIIYQNEIFIKEHDNQIEVESITIAEDSLKDGWSATNPGLQTDDPDIDDYTITWPAEGQANIPEIPGWLQFKPEAENDDFVNVDYAEMAWKHRIDWYFGFCLRENEIIMSFLHTPEDEDEVETRQFKTVILNATTGAIRSDTVSEVFGVPQPEAHIPVYPVGTF